MIYPVADWECFVGCRRAYQNLLYGPLKLKTAIAADEILATRRGYGQYGREIGLANLTGK